MPGTPWLAGRKHAVGRDALAVDGISVRQLTGRDGGSLLAEPGRGQLLAEGRHAPADDAVSARQVPARVRRTVVYIAGSGRSGSTLLERMLGTLPGFVNVGEINDLFRRVARYDERCGCGQPFSACDFWHGVGARAFGGWSSELVEEAIHLQREVARQRHLPQLMFPALGSESYRHKLARYAEIHARVYGGVLEQSGARVVVDASKGAAQAMAVSHGRDVDLRLLHLVRDARGVAFSWSKANVHRPHGEGERATMHSFRPADTALRWTSLQAEIAAVRRLLPASTLVRYEDLVADPARALVDALRRIDLPVEPNTLTRIDGCTVDLPVSHGLSGNPSRFRSGRQTLRADEQWRTAMSSWDRAATTVIAATQLGRYGYLRRRAEDLP